MGLNNNTKYYTHKIGFGSVSSDRYPDPAENSSIGADTEYWIMHPYVQYEKNGYSFWDLLKIIFNSVKF